MKFECQLAGLLEGHTALDVGDGADVERAFREQHPRLPLGVAGTVPRVAAIFLACTDVDAATAEGFQSDVKVTVTVDEAGVITGIVIDSANETPGFGTRCGEDETFINQFIGKTLPVALGSGIDAVSGATATSQAVVDALNRLAD